MRALVAIVLALVAARAGAGEPIGDEVKKPVVLISTVGADGKPNAFATGFFVVVPDEKRPKQFFYLATARHVLVDAAGVPFARLLMRINRKSGGADLLPVELSGAGGAKVFFPEDRNINLAILPALPSPPEAYDFKAIPLAMLQAREPRVREGDEAFWVGTFSGAQKNYPLVRFGRAALAADERIAIAGVARDLYLLDALASAADAGAPVFFRRNLLGGVVTGAFDQGLTAVTPAFVLRDLLLSPAVAAHRAAH